MRQLLAVAVATLTAAFGALILGEYEMAGWTPYVSGVLFGLVVAELVLTVARPWPAPRVMVAAAVLSGLGMVWALWISAGRDWGYVPGGGWVGAALAPVAALAWFRNSRGRRGGGRSAVRN
ncbi:MAG: hypothetical protein QOK43_72 [Acidimicrobiaceae bacterium]|nr:hypothetical protein [Acidimicrobiaceae bacterium]